MKTYLLLPHLRIHGANGMSCAYAAGFPAMTAFLGFVQALENKIGFAKFQKVGLVVHKSELQAYYQESSYCWNLKLRKAPSDRNGNASPIIEQALIHMEISLLIEVDGTQPQQEPELLEHPSLDGHDRAMALQIQTSLAVHGFDADGIRQMFSDIQQLSSKLEQGREPARSEHPIEDAIQSLHEQGVSESKVMNLAKQAIRKTYGRSR